jgi:hypothetical protein
MLIVITYSYMFAMIAYNDVLIMMYTVVHLLILDVVMQQLCYVLTMMCASGG